MRITPRVLARWLAIGGLWALIAVLTIPCALLHALNGIGLSVLEALKDRADALVSATDD